MKSGLKSSVARSLSTKYSLNHKANQIRRSWDEIDAMLKTVNKPRKK